MSSWFLYFGFGDKYTLRCKGMWMCRVWHVILNVFYFYNIKGTYELVLNGQVGRNVVDVEQHEGKPFIIVDFLFYVHFVVAKRYWANNV